MELSACGQELRGSNPRLREDGAQRSLRDVARVIGDRRVSVGGGVVPDLVTAGRLPIKLKAEAPEPSHHIAIAEPGQSTHQSLMTSG